MKIIDFEEPKECKEVDKEVLECILKNNTFYKRAKNGIIKRLELIDRLYGLYSERLVLESKCKNYADAKDKLTTAKKLSEICGVMQDICIFTTEIDTKIDEFYNQLNGGLDEKE